MHFSEDELLKTRKELYLPDGIIGVCIDALVVVLVGADEVTSQLPPGDLLEVMGTTGEPRLVTRLEVLLG